ncbi:MAG: CPBP family intramembrane metalloprotease [Actinomycetaceae bacterium]|nr:CPBP family intramembrane metalloprotease [Actinomycetaceae bacterium]
MNESVNSGGAIAAPTVSVREYLQGAKTRRYKWWKPIVAMIVAGVTAIATYVGLQLLTPILFAAEREAVLSAFRDGNYLLHPIALGLTLYIFIPIILAIAFAVLTIERRKFGTLTSVKGRMRWDVLGYAFVISALIMLPLNVLTFPFGEPTVNLLSVIPQFLVLLVLIPIQAGTEEYMYRGWLQQALGAWKAPTWLAIVLSTAAFTVSHPQYGPIGLAFVAIMGLGAAWLTIRTGGLEGAIALHVVNNYIVFSKELVWQINPATQPDMTWGELAYDALILLLVIAVMDWCLRRVIMKREGREVMTGALGGPVGNFGEKAAPVVSGPAVPTHGELSGAPSAPAGLTPEGVSRAWVSVGQNVNTSV